MTGLVNTEGMTFQDFDMPVEEEESSGYIEMLKTKQAASPTMAKRSSFEVAKLRSSVSGDTVQNEYDRAYTEIVNGGSIEEIKAGAMEDATRAARSRMDKYILENAGSSDRATRKAIMGLVGNYGNAVDEHVDRIADPAGFEKMTISAMQGVDIEDNLGRKEVSRSYAMSFLERDAEDHGVLDYLHSLGSSLILPENIDHADFVGTGDFFDHDDVVKFLGRWHQLDPEIQVAMFPSVYQRVKTAYDDDILRVRAFVHNMYDRDFAGDLLVTTVLDSMIFAEVGHLAVKGVKALVTGAKSTVTSKAVKLPEMRAANAETDAGNIAKDYQRVGNDEKAAEVVAAGAVEPNIAELAKMTPLDRAMSASPFRTTEMNLTENSLDNIADHLENMSVTDAARTAAAMLNNSGRSYSESALRKLKKVAVETPRQIAKLKDEIKAIDAQLVLERRGTTKGSKKSQAKAEVNVQTLTAHMESSLVRLAGLDDQLKKANTLMTAAEANQAHKTVASALRAGFSRTPLFHSIKAVNGAINDAVETMGTVSVKAKEIVKNVENAKSQVSSVLDEKAAKVIVDTNVQKALKLLEQNPAKFGLTSAFADSLRHLFKDEMAGIIGEVERIAVRGLSLEAKTALKEKTVANILKEAEEAGQVARVGDIVDMGDDGFTFVYHTNGKEAELIHKYSIDDVGEFSNLADDKQLAELGKLSDILLSPETKFDDLDSHLTDTLTFSEAQTAKIANQLHSLWKQSRTGLSKREKHELDALIMLGDEAPGGTVFDIATLESGTLKARVGKNVVSIKANDKVIEAYYKSRAFYDELHSSRNHFMRRKLDFLGYREASYIQKSTGETVNVITKPLASSPSELGKGHKVLFLDEGGYKNFEDYVHAWDDMRKGGAKYVELLEPHRQDGVLVKYAIIKDTSSLKNLPKQVINYKEGYLPRIYRPGYYFVKDMSDSTRAETLFLAETKEIGEKLKNEMIRTTGGKNIVVLGDRELSSNDLLLADAAQYGGLYTGSRKSTDIYVKGMDGSMVRPERLSVVDSTERYLNNLATFMPLAEYGSALQKQWIKSVEYIGQRQGRNGFEGERNFNANISLEPAQKRLMESSREYIKNQLSINTAEETFTRNQVQKLADAMYGSNIPMAKELRRALLNNFLDADPARSLKGFGFNMQLGMFNVRQYLVQMSNMAVAIAVDPKNGIKAAADAYQTRLAILSDDPNVWKEAAKYVTMDKDEYVTMVKKFRESGLLDSIKRQGDYDAKNLQLNGAFVSGVKKFAAAGRIFFTEGELMSRLVAFNIATRRLGAKATTKELFDESLRITFNMQSANAANWQKGAIGVPTQYQQVFAKFVERAGSGLLFNKGRWSRAEASRVVAMQIGLFGAGVSLTDELLNYTQEAFGWSPEEAQNNMPGIREALDEGLTGYVTAFLGSDNNYSKSMSLTQGVFESLPVNVYNALIDGKNGNTADRDLFDLMFGPSGSQITRANDAISTINLAVDALISNPNLDQALSSSVQSLDAVASLTSMWSNAKKAIFLHDVGIRSRKGAMLIDPSKFGDVGVGDLAARAMGFQFDIEDSYWQLKNVERTRREMQTDIKNALRKQWVWSAIEGDISSYNAVEAYLSSGLRPDEILRNRKELIKGNTGKDQLDSALSTHMKQFILSGGKERMNPSTADLVK